MNQPARILGVAVAISLALLSACSGDSDSSGAASSSLATTTTAGAEPATDTNAMCDAFTSIAGGAVGTANQQPTDAAGWEAKVAWTTALVTEAPAEWQEAAQKYLGVVKDRAALLAQYDYVAVNELPAEVRSEFIAENQADQTVSNDFIAYAKATCLP